MELQPPQGMIEKIKALGKLRELASFSAKTVKEAPCQEVWLDEPDLDLLPILTCWPDDGGPFITLPLVFSRDPVTGARNCGMYRIQKVDRRTAMMHWQIHKDGAAHLRDSRGRVPVAVAIGTHPATTYSATAPLPPGIDEMIFAGFLRGRSVEMVQLPDGRPRGAGRVGGRARGLRRRHRPAARGARSATTPASTRRWTTTRRSTSPACRCAATPSTARRSWARRRWRTSASARPPSGSSCRSCRMTLPDLVDMNLPLEGVFHNCAIVSVQQALPRPRQEADERRSGASACCRSAAASWWWTTTWTCRTSRRWPSRPSPTSTPAATCSWWRARWTRSTTPRPTSRTASKVGFDATRKWPGEGVVRPWPDAIVMSEDVRGARRSALGGVRDRRHLSQRDVHPSPASLNLPLPSG